MSWKRLCFRAHREGSIKLTNTPTNYDYVSYLRMKDHGRWVGRKLRHKKLNIPAPTYAPVGTENTRFKYMVIAETFHIDMHREMSINFVAGHPESLHAQFTIIENNLRVACWYRPVIETLWQFAAVPLCVFPVMTGGIAARMSQHENAPLVRGATMPRTITLSDHTLLTR